MAALIGKINEFREGTEDWTHYVERLEHYFVANNVTTMAKKQAVLLTVIGPESYKLLRSLVSPDKPGDKPYDELIKIMTQHHNPVPSEIVQRLKFNSRFREEGESIAQYVAALRAIANFCNYGTSLNDMLRDRLVCGVRDDRIQQKLLTKKTLTLEKALKIAQGFETATNMTKNVTDRKEMQVAQQNSNENSNAVNNSTPTWKSPNAYQADVVSIINDRMTIVIKNRSFNADLAGSLLREQFQASTANSPEFTARMIGQPNCSEKTADEAEVTTLGDTAEPTASPSSHLTTKPSEPHTGPTTTPPSKPSKPSEDLTTGPTAEGKTSSAPYDYAEVLHKSILFYEAQRSGALPPSNRIPWRHDSTLTDKGNNGEDLTGGWFNAGDYVKYGLPMASSATVLAWGLIEYRDAYETSGELDYMLDCIRWATDYFLKCHTGPYEFYGQVGNGQEDHGYWGRPEDMTFTRPAYKLTADNPGSEVVGETAAALAAASIAFRQTDPVYADTLLLHAEQLYDFANIHRGKYTDAIPDARDLYESVGGYGDELAWSAAWLYRATNDVRYLGRAEAHYDDYGIGNEIPWGFSWADKKAGVMLLLYQLTNSDRYKSSIIGYLDSWQPGRIQYTPKGLAFRNQWGPNRYAANTAFLALVAADAGIDEARFRDFAKGQINYMLGDGGRSFVVGFGVNPPHSPHHRSSSCPDKPQPCGWDQCHASGPNPHVVEGALVGGPDENDVFVDDRSDYKHNEPATNYNAGFQSAVAGLKSLDIKGLY